MAQTLLELVEASVAQCINEGYSPRLIAKTNTSQTHTTYQQLVAKARYVKNQITHFRGARVGLAGQPGPEALCLLMALDGCVAEINLFECEQKSSDIPDQLELDVFIDRHGEMHRLHDSTVSGASDNSVLHSTRWGLFTSGTTGLPSLNYHTLDSLIRTVKKPDSKSNELRWGLTYDLHRFAGLQVILQALIGGTDLVVCSEPPVNNYVEAFLQAGVNAISATPSWWRQLLMDSSASKLKLKQITLGGEIADQALLTRLSGQFNNARITHIYASTEAGVGFSVNDGRAGFPLQWLEQQKACGFGLKIVEGELYLKTSQTNEWMPSGDAVECDVERVYFVGRLSGVINVGGNKVYPEFIEQVLANAPGVEQVFAFPTRNTMLGSLVGLDVTVRRGENESQVKEAIRILAKEKLKSWQRPAKITVVRKMATTKAGKLSRHRT